MKVTSAEEAMKDLENRCKLAAEALATHQADKAELELRYSGIARERTDWRVYARERVWWCLARLAYSECKHNICVCVYMNIYVYIYVYYICM